MKNMMRCGNNPFEEIEEADLSFKFQPKAPLDEIIANLAFRFSEYKKIHAQVSLCLSSISDKHYDIKDREVLLALKEPIQKLVFAREALKRIEDALISDIESCNKFLEKVNHAK